MRISTSPSITSARARDSIFLHRDSSGMELEAKDLRDVRRLCALRDGLRILEEEEVRESSAKVRAVDSGVAGVLGEVYVLAFGAEELDGVLLRHVRQAHREHRLPVAVHAGAAAELALAELLEHELLAPRGGDEAGVDKAV